MIGNLLSTILQNDFVLYISICILSYLIGDIPFAFILSKRVKKVLEKYVNEWRYIQPLMRGDDLKDMGFKPGPIYREILNTLKSARLQDKIKTREEEQQLVLDKFRHYLG